MKQNQTTTKKSALTLLVGLVLSVAALAGCVADVDPAPKAVLTVDKTERWANEEFMFDGTASSNPNGQITRWHFDFGDGEEYATSDEAEAANVTHRYTKGGSFNATLTITDDGTNQTGKEAATDVIVVVVNEKIRVPPRVNYAVPETAGSTAESILAFEVNPGAVRYESNITLRSVVPAGTSTVMLRVLDPLGEPLDETEVTVEATSQVTEDLAGQFARHGTFTLEIVVTSGGVSTNGMLRVYYN